MVVALQALLLSAAGRGERFPVWRADAAELTASMLIAIGVRMFAVDARYIPTDSMEPTFAVGDHLLLDKVSRVFRPPARGDVVCFQPPPAAVAKYGLPAGSCYIKRVVAVAGDEVVVPRDRTADGLAEHQNKPAPREHLRTHRLLEQSRRLEAEAVCVLDGRALVVAACGAEHGGGADERPPQRRHAG